MTAMRQHRSVRAIGVVATVSAALPLCLTSCTALAPSGQQQVMELHATAESDLLEVSVERVYDITGAEIVAPSTDGLASLLGSGVASHGHIVLLDGVLTEALVDVQAVGFPKATFELTEPTALRREPNEEATVTVVGTLSADGLVRPDTSVRVTPTELSADSAEFDVSIDVPDNPFLADEALPVDEVAAHFTLAAR